MESLYRPIFENTIRFDYFDGRTFLKKAVTDPATPAICLFGSDDYAGQYLDAIKAQGKKFVFEGPGKDPFIVLPGADLETAARDSRYGLSGWIWETVENKFIIKQGPKLLSLETSYPKE